MFSQGTWLQKNNFSRIERCVGIGFSINGKGYIGLGKGASLLDPHKDFWQYDSVSDT
jgi:hypothetical protein